MKTPESATDIKVGGKTSDEIKKGLKCCSKIEGCKNGGCSYYDLGSGSICIPAMTGDALAYIQQLESDNDAKQKRIEELESHLAQVERERDAAVNELPHHCWNCAYHRDDPIEEIDTGGRTIHRYCDADYCFPDDNSSWQWRGVCPENTKEDK